MKGLPVAAIPQGHYVQVWFSSPTGDSSDSIPFDIPCHNADQARGLAAEYDRFIKGIYPIYEISETTQSVINGLMQQIAEQNHIISNLQTDVLGLMEMRENDFIQANQTIENLQNKLEATSKMLIKYYNQAADHWFDKTVSF